MLSLELELRPYCDMAITLTSLHELVRIPCVDQCSRKGMRRRRAKDEEERFFLRANHAILLVPL